MDEATYTSWETGFNTPNSSWMLGLTYKSDDPNILLNDADSSWGSMMCMEINPTVSGCGYAANYHQPFTMDRHLFETIPATDWRKKCFLDFAIDETTTRGSDERFYGQGYSAAAANEWANSQTLKDLSYNIFNVPDGEMLIGMNGKINPNATIDRSYQGNNHNYRFVVPAHDVRWTFQIPRSEIQENDRIDQSEQNP